ncbi:sodium/glutamate symporter [Shigella flexneri]
MLLGRSSSIQLLFEEIHHTGTCCGWFVGGAGATRTEKKHGLGSKLGMSLRNPLMLAFFATIGLNANVAFACRWACGWHLLDCGCWSVGDANPIGIGMASLLRLNPLMGLLADLYAFRRSRYGRCVE